MIVMSQPTTDGYKGETRRALMFLYALFALSATARSVFQIATKFDQAPLAYSLSAIAATFYLVALVALYVNTPASRSLAMTICTFELVGVLVVGTLTVIDSSWFADQTVWSYFGVEYGLLPLIMPVAVLWTLSSGRAGQARQKDAAAQES